MILPSWLNFNSFLIPAYSDQGNLSPVFCLAMTALFMLYSRLSSALKYTLLDFNFSNIVKMLGFFK